MSFSIGSGELFPGWDEGSVGMKVGGQRQLVIPPELAFGDQGAGPAIPPGTTLIVEMSLLEIVETPKMTEVDAGDYTTTDSGLMYYDLVEGDGAMAEAGQSVTVHYTGWLETGAVFDSSVERGQPFTFALGTGGVIAGWDEGVAGMKIGGKRQLVIPSDLAYGDQGSPGAIPPGATLIFAVELLATE
jgi:peptidylprolyl isomerase